MPQKTNIEPIEPWELICPYCRENQSTYRVSIIDGPCTVKIDCCGQCAALEPDVLLNCVYHDVTKEGG